MTPSPAPDRLTALIDALHRAALEVVTSTHPQFSVDETKDAADSYDAALAALRAEAASVQTERNAVMQALGVEYDAEDDSYTVTGKLAAISCATLPEAATAAANDPSAAWYRRAHAEAASMQERLAKAEMPVPEQSEWPMLDALVAMPWDGDGVRYFTLNHARCLRALLKRVALQQGAADNFGLPPDESPARDTVVELLTAELVAVGEVAYAAGEATTLNLRDERALRGLARYLTARDSGGRDGASGERKRVFWERLGAALAARAPTPEGNHAE